ncbi:hypothetical protein [Sorangium sp. So ce1099]|uniref:hypothetical protein n=1 Tax=Sorangium sp. So ce1099 TaxID=3133331 RepID=UPI003F5F9284
MSERNAPALDGARQRLDIEAVLLAAVLANAGLTYSRGVDDQHVVTPVAQLVVNRPGIPARSGSLLRAPARSAADGSTSTVLRGVFAGLAARTRRAPAPADRHACGGEEPPLWPHRPVMARVVGSIERLIKTIGTELEKLDGELKTKVEQSPV